MISLNKNLGFMQGRLSPIIDDMIQRFPYDDWNSELILAKNNNWNLMEWTIDYFTFEKNPILDDSFDNIKFEGIKIDSITADFFMQDPFFLHESKEKINSLILDFKKVINSMIKLKIKYIVLPLVDNASLTQNKVDEDHVIEKLSLIFNEFKKDNIEFIFESDYKPKKLLKFIEKFNSKKVGINYDSGNSASLGFKCEEEIFTYGQWIKNCHLKDRVFGGATVKFGEGNTDFQKILRCLNDIKYDGNFILQGARADNDEHLKLLNFYRDYIINILENGI